MLFVKILLVILKNLFIQHALILIMETQNSNQNMKLEKKIFPIQY